LYIAFVYGLRFLGQKVAKRGKGQIAENVATTRAIKTSTTGPNSLSELRNRCSTAELHWLNYYELNQYLFWFSMICIVSLYDMVRLWTERKP